MTDNNAHKSWAADVLDAGAALARASVFRDDCAPYAIIPDGYDVASIEHLMDVPARKRGDIVVDNLNDFCTLVNRYYTNKQNTLVTFDEQHLDFWAVLNYGDQEWPGWGDFRIRYIATREKEWLAWLDNDRKRMDIMSMTDFLDERVLDIVEPTSGDMIDMISNMRVRKNATFHNIVDHATGSQTVRFEETIKGETIKGDIEAVSSFKIAVAPFVGAEKYSIDCRFRLGIDSENKLKVYYQLINAGLCMRDAVRTMLDDAKKALDGFVLVRGKISDNT